MLDRRDTRRRAEALRRVVAWVSQQRSPIVRPPEDVAEAGAARRILTGLAIRGLVRCADGGWIPSAALASAAELVSDG